MPGRKEYRGASGILSLTGAITAGVLSFQADGDITGWPTGVAYPFVLRMDAGSANEEKILCSAMTAGTPNQFTVSQRGYDGTLAISHTAGAPVQHCADADSFDTFADHVFRTSRDDHLQYVRTDGSRGFTGLGNVAGPPVGIGTALAAGTSTLLVRADHVHRLNDGSIDRSTLFAAGVVDSNAIKNNSITNGDIVAKTITAASIADNTLTAQQIAPGAITSNELLDGTIAEADLSQNGYRVVHMCTSTTHPASPNVNDIIYETDTRSMLMYVSSITGYVPVWNMAAGAIGRNSARDVATVSYLNQGNAGTDILPHPTVSFTVAGNRWTKISANFPNLYKVGANGFVKVGIRIDGGTPQALFVNDTLNVTDRMAASGLMVIQLAAGAHTATIMVNSSAGGLDVNCSTYLEGDPGPGILFVEDAGPQGNPP